MLLKPCMRVQNVRSGNYSVMAANHTLILNWNDQTVPLLRQIAINRTERADNIYDGCGALALQPMLSARLYGLHIRSRPQQIASTRWSHASIMPYSPLQATSSSLGTMAAHHCSAMYTINHTPHWESNGSMRRSPAGLWWCWQKGTRMTWTSN